MRSLRRLREQIVRANLLVQEACFISDELERHTEYRVTLQIPSDNLNANRKVSHDTCVNEMIWCMLWVQRHRVSTYIVCVCVYSEGCSAQ